MRAASGEPVEITVNGEPVAELVPSAPTLYWDGEGTSSQHLVRAQADPELRGSCAPVRDSEELGPVQ